MPDGYHPSLEEQATRTRIDHKIAETRNCVAVSREALKQSTAVRSDHRAVVNSSPARVSSLRDSPDA